MRRDAAKLLILKAGRRFVHESMASFTTATATLQLFGEIASDVLGIAETPAQFEAAIRETVAAHPISGMGVVSSETARLYREAWDQVFAIEVLERLDGQI